MRGSTGRATGAEAVGAGAGALVGRPSRAGLAARATALTGNARVKPRLRSGRAVAAGSGGRRAATSWAREGCTAIWRSDRRIDSVARATFPRASPRSMVMGSVWMSRAGLWRQPCSSRMRRPPSAEEWSSAAAMMPSCGCSANATSGTAPGDRPRAGLASVASDGSNAASTSTW